LSILAAGCVGDIGGPMQGGDDDQPPPPDGSAKQLFVQGVHPVLAKCSGAACHDIGVQGGPIAHWASTNASSSYDAIVAAPETVGTFNAIAPIITKIDAGHQNVVYSQADRDAILAWLAKETEERQDPTAPPPIDPVALIKSWSGCMTQDNFVAAAMPDMFGGMAATNGQACRNCHNSGLAGFTVDNDPTNYFTIVSSSQSQFLKYFGVQGSTVMVSTAALTNAGTTISDHPRFDPMNNTGMPALLQFYNLTQMAFVAAGPTGCGPAKIVGP
jgi:hypothetical protein